jgi:hypothetical protein
MTFFILDDLFHFIFFPSKSLLFLDKEIGKILEFFFSSIKICYICGKPHQIFDTQKLEKAKKRKEKKKPWP